MILLDTHIFIFALADKLRNNEEQHLRTDAWSISAISLWEIAKLVQIGRLQLSLASPHYQDALSQIHIWPLSAEIAERSTMLDFGGDPADEIIAATSIVQAIPLVTRDAEIRGSKLVTFLN